MKAKLLCAIMVLISTLSFGQKGNRVKVDYSFMNSIFLEHGNTENSCHSEFFGINKVGILYNRKLYKSVRVETGIDFLFSNYSTEFDAIPNPIERDDKFYMISVPMILSIEFAKYFYVKGGFSVDFQTNDPKNSDKQSGIGGILGLGLKYDYKDYTFSLGFDYQKRRMKSFTAENDFSNYLHQFGIGISFGYNF